MRVKNYFWMVMETVNLRINKALHRKVKIAAAEDEFPLGVYADAMVELALKHRAEVKRLAEVRTKLEQQQEIKQ
jgi:hypothetical protein